MRALTSRLLWASLGLSLLIGCMDTPSKLDATPDMDVPSTENSPKGTLDRVKVNTDLAAIRAAIKMYQTDHENANAPDLDSLGVSGLHYPDAYTYDASDGTVRCDALGI